jgi:hypothetical protein
MYYGVVVETLYPCGVGSLGKGPVIGRDRTNRLHLGLAASQLVHTGEN